MTETVAQAVARLIIGAGVERGYTVPGESFLGLLDALDSDPGFTLVSTRHEGGASFMAEADGKLNGAPALAMASRGPGATNLSIGVHTAFQDETPMLVLLGQVPTSKRAVESFQNVDLAAMFTPLATWAVEATTAEEVPGLVAEGLARATGERPGPVVVSVPSDLWDEPFTADLPVVRQPEKSAPVDTGSVAERLRSARRPVVIAGSRDTEARAELVELVEVFGLGVYNSFRSQDAFPEDHPNYLGHLDFGMAPEQLEALEEADVLLVLGTRLEEVSSQGFRFPLASQELIEIRGGLPEALRGIRAHAGEGVGASRDWSTGHAAAVQRPASRVPEGAVDPEEVVRTLRALLPADTIATTDAGNFARALHRNWCFDHPHTYLGPRNGAMGYGVPSAVAAALSDPTRRVVAFCGDGGMLMTGQEIQTAVRLSLPVLVIVVKNGLYGTIAMHQQQNDLPRSAVDIGEVDFAAWATGLGARGLRLERPDQVEEVLRTAVDTRGPCVVDVRVADDLATPLNDFTED